MPWMIRTDRLQFGKSGCEVGVSSISGVKRSGSLRFGRTDISLAQFASLRRLRHINCQPCLRNTR